MYDSYDCFADVGGQVGVLLGLSFVAAFDHFVGAATKLAKLIGAK